MIDSQKIVPYFYCGLHCNYISEVLITSTCYINFSFIFWQYFNHKFCWSKNFDIYLHYYSFYTCALDVLVSVLNKFWNKLHAFCLSIQNYLSWASLSPWLILNHNFTHRVPKGKGCIVALNQVSSSKVEVIELCWKKSFSGLYR